MKRQLDYIDLKLEGLYNRLGANSSVDSIALGNYRILMGLLLLVYFLPSWQWLSMVPESLYDPHLLSLAYLFDSFPGKYLLFGLDILVLLFAVSFTMGIYSRFSCIALFFLGMLGYSFAYSFGKIDHGTTMFLFGILSLAFTNVGCNSAIVKDKPIAKKHHNLALAVLAIIICFGMFTAGLSKFIKWFDFDFSENGFLKWFYTGYHIYGRDYLLANTVFKAPYWVLELADYFAPIMELLGFYFLFRGKRIWRIYLIVLCVFHLGNLLLLNIPFTYNVFVYGIFLIAPLLRHFSTTSMKLPLLSPRTSIILLTGILGIYQFVRRLGFLSDPMPVNLDYEALFLKELYVGIVLWLVIILSGILLVLRKSDNTVEGKITL